MIRHVILAIATLCAISASNAQSRRGGSANKYSTKSKTAIKLFEEGMDAFMLERRAEALDRFEKAKLADSHFTEAYFMCAEVYRDLRNYAMQFGNLQKGIELDSTMYITGYYDAGVALNHLYRYGEAIEWFEHYKCRVQPKNMKDDVDQQIAQAKHALSLMNNPVPFRPQPLNAEAQLPFDTYWPSLSLDGNELVVTGAPTHEVVRMGMLTNIRNEDFFVTHKDENGKWLPMEPIASINTMNNEGAQALSPDGQWMFFTICGRDDSRGSCDIYFSRRTANGWSDPINIGSPVNSPYWESQPCFAADGRTLYFVSSRPGGKGGKDIWRAEICGKRANGVPIFSTPVNLGDSINTRGDEFSPFIHADNSTLYFSSNGWPGMGDFDIFMSRRHANGEWGKPINVGYPINTPHDDIGFIISASGETAYMAAVQHDEHGNSKQEIMWFETPEHIRPKPVSYIRGRIADNVTSAPVGATVELVDIATGQTVVTAEVNSQGEYIASLPAGHEYAMFVSNDTHLFASQNFVVDSASNTPMELSVALSPIQKDEKITLRNVFFDTNSATLRSESHIELRRLADIMKRNTALRIEIGGHTDNVGTAAYNQRLSEERARNTADYLVEIGIDKSRIVHKGYGMTKPVADNDTEQGRALNRRIEAKIL